jgi:hypothetical protein
MSSHHIDDEAIVVALARIAGFQRPEFRATREFIDRALKDFFDVSSEVHLLHCDALSR